MGKARHPASECARERPAATSEPQLLLCNDYLRRTGHSAWRSYPQGAALLLPRLRPIPAIHATDALIGQDRRSGEGRGRQRGSQGGIRPQVLEQTPLAVAFLMSGNKKTPAKESPAFLLTTRLSDVLMRRRLSDSPFAQSRRDLSANCFA